MLVGIVGHRLSSWHQRPGPRPGFEVVRYVSSYIVYLAPKTWLKARVLVLVGNLVHV